MLHPKPPVRQMLILPANSSASAFVLNLHGNHGEGLMFETEGDTLSYALKSDYGNYSDVLRKAFHHEHISMSRCKDEDTIEEEHSCLSVVLAGTPEQVRRLIPDSENGLLSRFIFYSIPFRRDIRDVFAVNDMEQSSSAVFHQMGEEFIHKWDAFNYQSTYQVVITPTLVQSFVSWLTQLNNAYCDASVFYLIYSNLVELKTRKL